MKDTFYFQHDYEPTSDPKIGALLAVHGGLGYGVWWRLIEMLHSVSEHKIEKKRYIYASLAQQMLTSVDQVSSIIEYCISECELFQSDGSYFWSDRVFRNIEHRNKTKEQKSLAGKASAEKRALLKSTVVQHDSTVVQRKPTKDRIGKDRIENKRIQFTPPTELEVVAYFELNGYTGDYARKAFRYYDVADWHDKDGKKVTVWKQKMQQWFRDEHKIVAQEIKQAPAVNINRGVSAKELGIKSEQL